MTTPREQLDAVMKAANEYMAFGHHNDGLTRVYQDAVQQAVIRLVIAELEAHAPTPTTGYTAWAFLAFRSELNDRIAAWKGEVAHATN